MRSGVAATTVSHKCSATDQERVHQLMQNIPKEVKAKLAAALVSEQQEEQSVSGCSSGPKEQTVSLPRAQGGKAVTLTVGKEPVHTEAPVITLKQMTTMSMKAHLTGAQRESVASDVRTIFGRKSVEPGLQKAIPEHNKKFEPFFKVQEMCFLDSKDNEITKNLYFCEDPVGFLEAVDKDRGRENIDQVTLVQGDTGQGWTKIAVSRISRHELECQGREKKYRRTREEGVEGGQQFSDWGSRRILILAIVRKVPESAHNLHLIFKAIKLHLLDYRLTGDFSFAMPCFGLNKGCSSCNPCSLCDQERTKLGGGGPQWVVTREPSLRTFESLRYNLTGWVLEGRKPQPAKTKKWKSVTGHILVQGVGDTPQTLVLDKLVPGPLHLYFTLLYLYLALNEVFNHCEKDCWPEIKEVFGEVAGAVVHMYQGKIGNYQGPQIRKIFRKLDSLRPLMLDERKNLYFNLLEDFKHVSQSVIGTVLHTRWREHLHALRVSLQILSSQEGMPLTPKLHVLVTHVEQWVDRNNRSLGMEGESSGEALHHIWLRLLEGQGKAKEKESPADVKIVLAVLLRFNANNC